MNGYFVSLRKLPGFTSSRRAGLMDAGDNFPAALRLAAAQNDRVFVLPNPDSPQDLGGRIGPGPFF